MLLEEHGLLLVMSTRASFYIEPGVHLGVQLPCLCTHV